MSLNIDQAVERVFSQLPGTPRPEIRDDISQCQFDALSSFGEVISNSPLRQALTRDFQCATVGGSADLNTATLVGGAALSTANIQNLVFDTIKRGKATHPDALEVIQWERGGTIAVDKPKRDQYGFIYGTVSSASVYLRKEDGTPVSDQPNFIFKCSFSPLIGFFSGTSPVYQELETILISVWVKLVSSMPAMQQPAA
jgi:hypothetical protein